MAIYEKYVQCTSIFCVSENLVEFMTIFGIRLEVIKISQFGGSKNDNNVWNCKLWGQTIFEFSIYLFSDILLFFKIILFGQVVECWNWCWISNVVVKCNLEHLKDTKKVKWFHYKTCIYPSFWSSSKQKRKHIFRHSKFIQSLTTCRNDMIHTWIKHQ